MSGLSKPLLFTLVSMVLMAGSHSVIADQNISTDKALSGKTYTVDFNATTQSNEQKPFSSLDKDDDFKALFYPGGIALLIDPRRFMTQDNDNVDEQIAELNANAIAYHECRKAPGKTEVSKKKPQRVYTTDLSSMEKDGYDCSPRNQ